MDRREFLKQAALRTGALGATLTGFPYIVKGSALGKDGAVTPGNKITVGFVGLGWMGGNNLNSFLPKESVQVVAICDIFKPHLESAVNKVNEKYGDKGCASYHNMFEMFARGDLDAVILSLPDHWHGVAAVAAARAGLDIYSEKPFALKLREGRAICDAVKQYGCIWQTGSWQRSVANFHRGAELVRNGRIGKVHTIEVGLGQGHPDLSDNKDQTAPMAPPPDLDYDMWLGPAPQMPYCPARLHKNWRWVSDTGGGLILDWIGHHGDIAHWGVGLDYGGPVQVEGTGVFPTGLWNTPTDYDCYCTYEDGMVMRIASSLRNGCKWIGDKGSVFVTRGEVLEVEPKSVLDEVIAPEEIHLYKSTDHQQNFLDCIRSRRETITPAEIAHRSASLAQLSLVAMQTGRKLQWDAKTETVVGDAEANQLLGRPMRAPWHV